VSYISTALRFTFAGDFKAAPSTVNNDVTHYDNAHFDPSFQLPQTATAANGWWNPRGDHAFIINAGLRSGQYTDGAAVPTTDPALNANVLTVNTPPGSIVDLDPQQQMVSTLFGVRITIPNPAGGAPFLQANLATVAFANIWSRGRTGAGDERACAMYQSILESLVWGNVAASRLLTELRSAAASGFLSIKFNVDGYHMGSAHPRFTMGRIVGTVGPADASEPRHFVVGRHLEVPAWVSTTPIAYPSTRPARGLNYAVAVVDETAKMIRLDLGNAMPVNPSAGDAADLGPLDLVCDAGSASPLHLGPISYTAPGWYESTAGIVELPAGRPLTAAELSRVRTKPLTVTVGAAHTAALVEHPQGLHVRADDMVWRLNPGEDQDVSLRASQWGRPLAGAKIDLKLGEAFEPGTGTPTTALTFPATITTDAQGAATARIHGADPGNPRGYVDGQVYRLDYALHGQGQRNLSDYLSVLAWNQFVPDTPTTWHGSIKEILVQYGNLYPIMSDYFDLTNYDDVSANRAKIIARLSKPVTEAEHMPISRDLSAAKRAAIIAWLTAIGPDGKPLLGTPPPSPLALPTPAAPLGKAERAQRIHS
jgi:hypothetical protein